MTEPTNESDEQLERMLRRWGADEAVRQQQATEPGRPSKQRPLLLWLPAAVAAVLLFAAAATFYAGLQRSPDDPDSPIEADRRVDLLQRELSELVHEMSAVEDRAAEAEDRADRLAERLAETETQHQQQLAQLREQLQTAGVEEPDTARERIERLREQLNERLAENERLREQLDRRGEQAEELAERLAETERLLADAGERADRAEKLEQELEDTRLRLAAAVEEMERMRRDEHEVREARRELAAELNRLEMSRAALWRDFQKAYLGSPDEDFPLGVRQRAVERHRLLVRAAAARRMARSAETAELIDRIEVVLTRLMMLPPDDPPAEEAFAQLVEYAECLPRLEAALARQNEPRAVNVWLMEAKLVLMGAGHVG